MLNSYNGGYVGGVEEVEEHKLGRRDGRRDATAVIRAGAFGSIERYKSLGAAGRIGAMVRAAAAETETDTADLADTAS